MKPITRNALALILGLMTMGPVIAQAGDIPWSSLSADEQRILSRAHGNWDQLPTERQQRLLNGAHRWQEMNPQQREQARERWQERRDSKGDRRYRD